MKGIILAGGAGSRLYPLTSIFTKQLQPIYDKPMIYYPLSILMLGNIREVLIISTPDDLPYFQKLLGAGEDWGMKFEYKVQEKPRGLADAYIVGEEFIDNKNNCMILGDNLFHGDLSFVRRGINSLKNERNAVIFGYEVSDPRAYGVVEYDLKSGKVISIEEKPEKPKSNFAIPGLYLFDGTVSERAKKVQPSKRGEIEITSVMESYLHEDKLSFERINRGVAWLDTGTPQNLTAAGHYIMTLEERQGRKVACPEEIALLMQFIDENQYKKVVEKIPNSPYRTYLESVVHDPLRDVDRSF